MRREQSQALQSIITILSLSLVASCSNSEALGNFVNADPQLQAEQTQENLRPDSTAKNPATPQRITTSKLPEEIPEEIPLSPQAELEQTAPESTNETDSLGVRSPENIKAIALPNGKTQDNIPEEPEVASKAIATTKTTENITNFDDLAEVREQLQQAVTDVAALGILTPQSPDSLNQFAPHELVTRRDYVRWLVAANNKFHENSPGKKIHRTKNTTQKAFKDIEINDPDFGEIQGLAEAGLIPSILTSDSNNVLFRPDAILTREDLISWKVPLDVRAALSKASIETIEETWGFQDAAKIDPQAIRALFSDYQNSDRANVRRVFGYTTLFQPKRGVTRAEAAASLWYFGYQNDGISAEELQE